MNTLPCPNCDYTTNRTNDLKKHLNRKIPCTGALGLVDEVKKLKKKVSKIVPDSDSDSDSDSMEESEPKKVVKKVKKVKAVKKVKKVKVVKKVKKVKAVTNVDDTNVDDTNVDDTDAVLKTLVDKLHNIMRSEEQITGSTALGDITLLLFWRFLEPMIMTGSMKYIIEKETYGDDYDDYYQDYVLFSKLYESAKLDNLSENNDDPRHTFSNKLTAAWDMLAVAPITKEFFKVNRFFNCNPKTIKKCVKLIHTQLDGIDFDSFETDVKGSMYEYFINDYANGKGKDFGQYFTPRYMIDLIFKMQSDLFSETKVNSIYDPCVGSAGFLTHAYNTLKSSGTTLDPENVCGNEFEPGAYARGLINLILTLGDLPNINRTDSLKDNTTKQFDWILTNPPFGIKGIKYKELVKNSEYEEKMLSENKVMPAKKGSKKVTKKMPKKKGSKVMPTTTVVVTVDKPKPKLDFIPKKEMYPITTNNAPCLFLMHCIAKLAPGGICCIVMPDGQELSGRGAYIKIRKYLCDTCDLKAVLQAPNGVFTHAGVSTAILFFQKPYPDGETTEEVTFYSTDKKCNDVEELATVTYEQLAENNFVLSYNSYKPEEPLFSVREVEWKTLGEVCDIVNGKNITRDKLIDGPYPVIGGGKSIMGMHNVSNQPTDTLTVSKDGAYAGYVQYHSNPIYVTGHGLILNNCRIDKKYLYYYLRSNQDKIYLLQKGSAQPGINKVDLDQLKIPIPSLKVQEEIVADCEQFSQSIDLAEQRIKQLESTSKLFLKYKVMTVFNEGEEKTLGEVCDIVNGKNLSRSEMVDGPYPVIGGGKTPSGKCDKFNRPANTILCSSSGTAGYISMYDTEVWASDCMSLTPNETIINKYLYYYLISNKDKIYNLQKGTAQPHVYKVDLEQLKIPVPSIEVQEEIVAECNFLKMQCDNEIKNIKTSNMMINTIISSI